MKILFIAGRENVYIRNKVLLNALSKEAELIDITSNHKIYFIRLLIVLYKFITNRKPFDLVFVGFYGQIFVPIVRLITKKPIIFDAFVSTYQTLCFDRKKFSPSSFVGKLAFFIDKLSCNLSNIIILDTQAHIDYFVKTYKLPKEKFYRIFVGTDEKIFYPRPNKNSHKNPKLVLFYSEYQPLHGIKHIIQAANLLKTENIEFKIIGKGKERQMIDGFVKKLKLKNVKLIDWINYKKLPDEISHADICIGGHLGDTEKAKLVIPGKTFQFIAMKKPTIISQNSANSELFGNFNQYYSVRPGDFEDLAKKIKKMIFDNKLLDKIGNEQYIIYQNKASNKIINNQIKNLLATI